MINRLTIDPAYGTDYVYESSTFALENRRMWNDIQLSQTLQESEIILEYLSEIGEIVTEADAGRVAKTAGQAAATPAYVAGAVTKTGAGITGAGYKAGAAIKKGAVNAKDKIKNFFKRIIDFLKNMTARFKDNLQGLFQNGGKWVEQRKEEFAKIKYDDLSTDIVPYWTGPEVGAVDFVTRDLKKGLPGLTGSFKSKDLQTFQSNYLKNFHDKDGDLKEGLMNFYRVRNVNGKDRVSVSGSTLKNLVSTKLIPYITNYQNIIRDVENQTTKVQRELDAITRRINDRDIATESFLFGVSFEHTEIGLYEDLLHGVMEAGNEKPKDSAGGSNTNVTVTKDKRTNDQKANDNEQEKFSSRLDESTDNQLKVYYNYATTQQLILTTYLTVMEERYIAYMNVLKAVWKAGNTVGARNQEKETPAQSQ